MKQLLILSGKGGTGKTTTAAAFARFSGAKALADCDVDAPNLHLVLERTDTPQEKPFFGAQKYEIDANKCIGCGICAEFCRFDAMRKLENGKYAVIDYACEGCGVCALQCPQKAVFAKDDVAGTQALYPDTPTFSTATLKMGRGNSGKLVTQVKNDLRKAAKKDVQLAIIDGSPGIGCPVIASVTGVDLALIVAEPSKSGRSDLERLLKTASILHTHVAVCVNKADIMPEETEAIRQLCKDKGIAFVGTIPYDKTASQAINSGKSLADFDCPAKDALYAVYSNTMQILEANV